MPNYELAAERAAKKYGINPKIFKAMIRQESGFRVNAQSGAGAKGIAQFIDSTAKAYGVNARDNRATDDLEGAARYLKDNLKRTGGNYQRALSIYNSGRPDTFRDPGFAQGQTYNYVRKIMAGAKGEKTQESGGSPSSGEPSRSREVRTSRTIPGEDNSDLRKQLILQFLQNRGRPDALPTLAAGLKGAQDTPDAVATTRKTVRDATGPSTGSTGGGKGSGIKELFYNGPGGVNIDAGKRVPKGFVKKHRDHVHAAAGPETILKIAKLAEQMGLTVRELAPYDKVDPVHTQGSFHYKRRAGDFSGTPEQMAAFSREVARRFG